jgi:hypothetical protein
MKFEDLKKLPHILICEYTGNTLHLHTEEGYYLTDFNNEDYLNYDDFFCTFLPIKEEYPNFQVITEEIHNANVEKRNALLEENLKKELEKIQNKIKEMSDN